MGKIWLAPFSFSNTSKIFVGFYYVISKLENFILFIWNCLIGTAPCVDFETLHTIRKETILKRMRLLKFGDRENASSFPLELDRGGQWTLKNVDQVPHISTTLYIFTKLYFLQTWWWLTTKSRRNFNEICCTHKD